MRHDFANLGARKLSPETTAWLKQAKLNQSEGKATERAAKMEQTENKGMLNDSKHKARPLFVV